MNGLEALKEMRESATLIEEEFFLEGNSEQLAVIEQELKALDILTKSLALEMSVDEDYAVLSVKISKDKLCVVGSVKGKENIEPLKAVMKYYEEAVRFH